MRYHSVVISLRVVVIDVAEAETLLDAQSFWEHLDISLEIVLTFRIGWVIYENDSMNILLARCPALLVFKITTQVPNFDVDLTKLGNTWGRISLKIDNSSSNSWSVNG